MPKYLVTSSSHFEPFTYEELVRPVAHMQQIHDATQDAYDTLSLETNALANYITNNPEDYDAKVMYDNYVNKLNTLQNNLQRNGINGQTRRDLSDARAGYASDITRIARAIQNRQERSKEYWDARHKNPDLVVGKDPGLSGLNDYLKDDNYGMNWFSYDSAKFEKEVYDETKARAQQMLRGLQDPNSVIKNPALVDQLTRVITQGFTNKELEQAGVLVDAVINLTPEQREAVYENSDISPVASLLAESLINRYDATGIRNSDVALEERQRLLNRGKAGWVGGVMAPDVKDFKDAQYEQQQKYAAMRYQHALANSSKKQEEPKKNPTSMGMTMNIMAPGYEAMSKATRSEGKAFENGQTKTVMLPDGTSRTVTNEFDLSDLVYSTRGRDLIRSNFGGYDIALSPRQNKEVNTPYTFKRPSASEAKKYGITEDNGIIVRDKKTGKIVDDLTQAFNSEIKTYNEQVDFYKNQEGDILKSAISPEKQAKLRKDNDYPDVLPWSDFYDYSVTRNYLGEYSPGILVGNDTAHDYARENLALNFIGQYNSHRNSKGEMSPGSRFAIHKVGEGGLSHSTDTYKMEDVLGTKNKGSEIRSDTIRDISALPEDVIGYGDNGEQRIRFRSSLHNDSTFDTSPIAFGPKVETKFKSMQRPVAEAMRPLNDPAWAMYASDAEQRRWAATIYNMLGSDREVFPIVDLGNGNYRPAVPAEIVRNSSFRAALRNAVTQNYINLMLSDVRSEIQREHEQHTGETNANALSPVYYNTGIL